MNKAKLSYAYARQILTANEYPIPELSNPSFDNNLYQD